MDQQSERRVAALQEAARMLGGTPQLAAFLAVPEEQLEAWMASREAAPLWVFVQTNDLVTDNPSTPPRQAAPAARRKRFCVT